MTSVNESQASSCSDIKGRFDSELDFLDVRNNGSQGITHDVKEAATRHTIDETSEYTPHTEPRLLLEGALPKPSAAKPLKFGAMVEAKRSEIAHKRQTCRNMADYQHLYAEIDEYIAQALTAGKPAIALRLQLDKAVVAHFGQDFDLALEQVKSVTKRVRQLDSPDDAFQLELTCSFLQCSIYSRQGKFGRGFSIVQKIAPLIKGSENSMDHWRLHYNLGTNILGRLKASNVGSDRLVFEGVSQFKLCRQQISDGESRNQHYDIENHFYALVMAAKLLLDLPEHPSKREMDNLSHDKIMKAQDLLQVVCTDYPLPRMVIRFKLRLLITFAGLYFRRGQRATRDKNPIVAYSDFIHALLILECSSLLCTDSPYEERQMIADFLKELQNKCFKFYTARCQTQISNIFHVDVDGSGSEHALDESYLSEFNSDDMGNPSRSEKSHKARKRRTIKARRHERAAGRCSESIVASLISTSTLSTEPGISSPNAFYTLTNDVMRRIELQHAAENISHLFSSDHSNQSLSSSLASSAGVVALRMHRDDSIDVGYPIYEPEVAVPYKSPSETSSSLETDFLSQSFDVDDVIDDVQPGLSHSGSKKKPLVAEQHISYNYHYLTQHSVNETAFATRQTTNSLTTSSTYRMGILSEISFVRQFMSSCRNPRYDKEDLCIPLLVSAKLALDFPEYAANTSRFVISLSDLKSAFMTINVITESLPVDASSAMKSELLLIMASFYFRSAQFAAKYNMPGTCKFCLNMAILYAEFAEVMTSELDRKRRLWTVQAFHNNLCKLSACYLDKKDGSILLGVAQL